MRLLQTSDWHLGRTWGASSMLDDQARFVDWFVEVATVEQPDLVVVAGDVFDRAVPSVDAVALADEAFARLVDTGASVVVISGNHDSPGRLGFNAAAASRGRLFVETRPAADRPPGRLRVPTRAGGAVDVLALPYADPLRRGLAGVDDDAGSHAAALGADITHLMGNADLAPCIVVAHAFVAGGVETPSERPLAVGGTGAVPTRVFRRAQYVALGHLHGRQEFAGGRVAYAGSPLPYSFAEQAEKSVRLVELDLVARIRTARAIPVEVGRVARTLRGTLDDLVHGTHPGCPDDAWIRAELLDPEYVPAAMARLRTRFPNATELEYVALRRQERLGRVDRRELLDPAAIVERYLAASFDTVDDELRAVAHEALVRAAADAAAEE